MINAELQSVKTAPSRGRFINSGNGPSLQPVDIGHKDYTGLVDADTAFWSLIRKDSLADMIADASFISAYGKKTEAFTSEMNKLRFGQGLSCVYVNPTGRCNLNCEYCYIPEDIRRDGPVMERKDLFNALDKLVAYFKRNLPDGRKPSIIFHGAEPMLERESVFAAIDAFSDYFRFGIQSNGTLIDKAAADFIIKTGTGIGLSLDAPLDEIASLTRRNWEGAGVYRKVLDAIDLFKGYHGMNVICTMSSANMKHLEALADFFYEREIPAVMFNLLRCTLPRSRSIKPDDAEIFPFFEKAILRTHELYKKHGRKMIVANFANILLAIMAPAARKLMCDISPCGGGRVFFAMGPDGGIYPCSEFIGLEEFRGGNLFTDDIDAVLETEPFRKVTGRKVEDIVPCNKCAIRHFCGSPCPAEAYTMNGGMQKTGAFCEFYEEQVRFAMRLIADGIAEDFLWDAWDKDTHTTFSADMV